MAQTAPLLSPFRRARVDRRELAARESGGLRVLLLWHPRSDEVSVSVDDTRTGECFELPVQRDRALDAFYHPFAHAA
jgi:hypothetical protein